MQYPGGAAAQAQGPSGMYPCQPQVAAPGTQWTSYPQQPPQQAQGPYYSQQLPPQGT